MGPPEGKPRCGAKSKQTGRPCKAYPLPGKKRCKNHGGASTGAPKGNANGVTHGVYSSVLKGDDLAYYEASLKEIFGDVKGALLHDAAVMRAAARRALSRINSTDDMCIVEQKTVEGIDEKGNPVSRTEEKRIGVMGPVSDVLNRAASIAVKAFDIDPEADEKRRLDRERTQAEINKLNDGLGGAADDKPILIEIRDFREPSDGGGEGSGS